MKILDLFCGAGGFFHGFSALSDDTHLAIDIDEPAIETYRLNHPNATILQTDIHSLHSLQIEEELGGTPDIIIASPPCEEFSKQILKVEGLQQIGFTAKELQNDY